MLKPVHSQLLACLHRERSLSRAQLHRRTGIRPNTVGTAVEELLDMGVVRFGALRAHGRGPRHENIEINPTRRYVVGLAIAPKRVEVARMNLYGELVGKKLYRDATSSTLLDEAMELLQEVIEPKQCMGLGISVPGFVDPDTYTVSFSSAFPQQRDVDLKPMLQSVGDIPITLDSEVHAFSTHWLLCETEHVEQSVLLVSLRDGEVGSSLLLDGKPCRGSVLAGNELGHTQFPIETEPCYCGQVGCLERIFSTAFLQKHCGVKDMTLDQALATFDPLRTYGASRIAYLLAMAIGNAVNFVRPNRLVLAGEMIEHTTFIQHLRDQITSRIFPELTHRMQVETWCTDVMSGAQSAARLALSNVFGIRHEPLQNAKNKRSETLSK